MNYKIIQDIDLFNEFIEFLPEELENEKFYVSLLARKKYNSIISQDKAQLKRFITNKKDLIKKLKQLEIEVGGYNIKGVEIPQDSLAVYINPNPKNTVKASFDLIKSLAENLKNNQPINPVQEALTAVHKSASRKVYFDINFDHVDLVKTKEKIEEFINPDCVSYLKTRGGFHVLIKLDKIESTFTKSWYKNITTLQGADVSGDVMVPIPGCTQGGFIPYFLKTK